MAEDKDREESTFELSDLQKKIVAQMQGNIPLTKEPYQDMARELGISESDFLEELKTLKARGVLRRVGAILKHRNAGYSSNAMVAWQVPEDQVEPIGEIMSNFTAASHVYQRPTYPGWPYNLFTMIHAATSDACYKIASQMSEASGITNYQLLFSSKEYKKTSMTYF